jgi:ribosome-associated toxin RatA of RatAB toxin-antitoxin module
MTTIKRAALVPYSAKEMYDLVNDIGAYPQFLPWCKESDILSSSEDEIRARLHLAWMGVEKSFTTCNRLQPHKMIEIGLIDGPFHHLQGFWRFTDIEDKGARIQFDLNFQFSNTLLDKMIGTVFTQIANNLVEAFCKRAIDLYGFREVSL